MNEMPHRPPHVCQLWWLVALMMGLAPISVAAQPRYAFAESIRSAAESLAQAAPPSIPSPPRDPDRDSWWNGIILGAAVGIVASVTTGAEAPRSGKVISVVGFAAAGGWVDSRFDRTPGAPPGLRPAPPATVLRVPWRIRV